LSFEGLFKALKIGVNEGKFYAESAEFSTDYFIRRDFYIFYQLTFSLSQGNFSAESAKFSTLYFIHLIKS
jgi:hypothetical protein